MNWSSLFFAVFLIFSPFHHSLFLSSASTPLCHLNENSALLQFKNSFSKFNNPAFDDYCEASFYEFSTSSWENATDCCTWSGVTCDNVTGHVIGLDLACSRLQGFFHPNNSLFSIVHLKKLVLSANDFRGSSISSEFGRFIHMTHLEISYCNFSGSVPVEISNLKNLETLVLSGNVYLNNYLTIDTLSMERTVTNLTNMKKLSLPYVDMSSVAPNSLLNLSSSLTYLGLLDTGFRGEFPVFIWQLPNLKFIDLSYNQNLTGKFPNYNWTSPLNYLSLSYTGFSIDFPYLTKSLKFLNSLYLRSCKFIGSYPKLLGNLTQVTDLDLSYNEFGGQFPWSSLNLESLSSLLLSGNNFIGQLPEICNSTRVSFHCDTSKDKLPGPVPLNLQILYLSDNMLNGSIPSWLYTLPSLLFLGLGNNQFTGNIGNFHHNSLMHLSLSGNNFHGSIPSSIFRQMNLVQLDLSSNQLKGVIGLDQFSKLEILLYLDLSFNKLTLSSVNFKSYIFPKLRYLALSSCNITKFPYSLATLESLESLDLSHNQIEGSVPKWLWNVTKNSLHNLNLSHNFLTNIEQLPWKQLQFVDLRSNLLQGNLPSPPLSTVVFLISNNQLKGNVPSLFCNMSSLRVFDLSNNRLSGDIPSCIVNSSGNLLVLDLSKNMFNGTIPATFAKGNSLRNMNLNGNQLEGPIPPALLNCSMLEVLDLGNNKLNGSFPHWLGSLSFLQILILRSNKFFGTIGNPKVRFPFPKLQIMDLSDNEFNGSLPVSYFESLMAMMDGNSEDLNNTEQNYYQDSTAVTIQYPNVEFLRHRTIFPTIDFSRNNFQGEIPKLIGNLKSLKGLNISHNRLIGPIPTSLGNLTNLEWLALSSNKLGGQIPLELAVLTKLKVLDFSNNSLSGKIPAFMGSFSLSLSVLDLRTNKFQGSILMTSFAKGNSLRNINLNGNQLKGPIPKSLLNCGRLEVLDLGNNNISDSFPQWLETLPMLQVLILRSNIFHGPIGTPKTRYPFQKLRIMDVSRNKFKGILPTEYLKNMIAMMDGHAEKLKYMGEAYYQDTVIVVMKGFYVELMKIQTIFTTIDFSENEFEGKIPEVIGKLKSLKGLNFSHNELSNTIPSSLSNLTNLEWLDFSSNKLGGEIPSDLSEMTSLAVMNLSYNQLVGAIPRGNQFGTFDNSSYIGNMGLCGFPLFRKCNNDEAEEPSTTNLQEEDDSDSRVVIEWKFVVMGYGCGTVFGISMGYIVLSHYKVDWFLTMIVERWQKRLRKRPKGSNSVKNGSRRTS